MFSILAVLQLNSRNAILTGGAVGIGGLMRITVNVERCCGAGQCVVTAPDVFDQNDDDGRVVVLVAEPPTDRHADVRQAVKLCPARAIALHDE
jgi:ferredoxin